MSFTTFDIIMIALGLTVIAFSIYWVREMKKMIKESGAKTTVHEKKVLVGMGSFVCLGIMFAFMIALNEIGMVPWIYIPLVLGVLVLNALWLFQIAESKEEALERKKLGFI